MNTMKSIAAGVLLASVATASGTALADGGHHHWHHGGARFGVIVGAPVFGFGFPYYGYPGYAYGPYGPYGYYGPSTTVVAAPPVYVEQGSAAVSGPASDGNWYYCRNPDGYYPYVRQCAESWQKVPPQPVAH